jgi:hypothetical protein
MKGIKKSNEEGFVYMPYVLQTDIANEVSKVTDVQLSRYAMKVVNNSYYGSFGVKYKSPFEENLDNIIRLIEES